MWIEIYREAFYSRLVRLVAVSAGNRRDPSRGIFQKIFQKIATLYKF